MGCNPQADGQALGPSLRLPNLLQLPPGLNRPSTALSGTFDFRLLPVAAEGRMRIPRGSVAGILAQPSSLRVAEDRAENPTKELCHSAHATGHIEPQEK